MKLLFLSTLVKGNNLRDSVTYGFIVREMQGLAKRGHKVYFFVRRNELPTPIPGVEFVLLPSKWKLRIRMLKIALSNLQVFARAFQIDFHHALQVLKSEAAVDRFLKQESIDIIHTHFLSPSGECCVIAGRSNGIPVLATLRGAELRNSEELEYGSMRNPAFRYMFSWAKSYLAFITAPNQELIDQLETSFAFPTERTALVPNGVETTNLPDEPVPGDSNTVKLIAVGWLTKLKNHQVLLDAFKLLKGQNIELTIVGEGGLEGNLLSQVDEFDLSNINILPNMPRSELLPMIASADCLVHPSLMEGMPNVVLEALCIGIPCIVSDIGAHRGIIVENYNGYFFPTMDAVYLAALLKRLVGQPYLLSRMSPNCKNARVNYSLESKLISYETIYHKIGKSV